LALYTTTIQRLLAYSAVTHIGFIIIGLAGCSVSGLDSFISYIVPYAFSSVGIFGILLTYRNDISLSTVRSTTELSGMALSNPILAFVFSVFLLSSAGIPPLAGFVGKFIIFFTLMEIDAFFTSWFLILLSVVNVIYYIRFIRFTFFNQNDKYKRRHK